MSNGRGYYSAGQLEAIELRVYLACVTAWHGATDTVRAAALAWYFNYMALALQVGRNLGKRGSAARVLGAAIIAVISPKVRWSANQVAALAISVGDVDAAMPLAIHGNIAKALAMIDHEDPMSLCTGPKVGPFGRAGAGDFSAVVIDSVMCRAFGVEQSTLKRKGLLAAIIAGVERAARDCEVDNAAMQALVWIVTRGSAE
jgi:hypothetical protein